MNTTEGSQAEMPKYKSHKIVHALKIKSIANAEGGEQDPGGVMITPVLERYAPFYVDGSYVKKHNPQPGGYYVVYKGGYKSWSPKEAFENGYTLIVATESEQRPIDIERDAGQKVALLVAEHLMRMNAEEAEIPIEITGTHYRVGVKLIIPGANPNQAEG